MKTIILENPVEILRFIEVLNEYNRAPLSAYWDACYTKGAYLDELEYPVSRSVLGEIEKRARNLTETGKSNKLSNSYKQVWKKFNPVIARHMKKLGLVTLEKHGKRIFVKPLIKSIIIKTGEGQSIETIMDVSTALMFIRKISGSSRTRQHFNKRLKKEVPDTVEIIFPGWL